MNKIRVIDLLNKIANGEDVPKKIKWRDKIWDYWEGDQDYKSKQGRWFTSNLNDIRTKEFVNDTVEIIEEQEEIDIQKLDENIKYYNIIGHSENEKMLFNMIQNTANRINKLVQAVKQLDKKMEEKNNGIK